MNQNNKNLPGEINLWLYSITWANRLALSVVFIWFGALKLFHLSPAEPLITHLHKITLPGIISIDHFIVLLGSVECAIGILWLLPSMTRWAFHIFSLHMFTTFLPLAFLTGETWQNQFALTLTGQYIVKNIVLIASAATIFLLYDFGFERKFNRTDHFKLFNKDFRVNTLSTNPEMNKINRK